MSTFEHDESDDDRGRDALVHALLQEELGDVPQPDLGDRVLARFAAGDGRAALAHVQAAAGLPDPATAGSRPRRSAWLVAAAALFVVAAVLYESWARRHGAGDDRGATTQPPIQEPQEPKPPLPVGDLANLRAHLPKVTRVTLEVLALTDPRLPFRVEVAGAPNTFTEGMQRRLLADLRDAAERVEPAGAAWSNRLVLWLEGGDRFELSVDTGDRGPRTTLHTSGMDGDLRLGVDGSEVLEDAMAGAVHIACLRHQIAVDAAALRDYARTDDPGWFDSLRLFRVAGDDLTLLSRFPNLRRLDLSGMARKLTEGELRTLMQHCEPLEELVLDGLPFSDDDLHLLADMVNLRKLSLRSAKEFTGRGFFWLNVGAKRRVGPLEIDLTGVTTLTDRGLLEIARHDPETLHLGSGPGGVTPDGAMALLRTKRLRTLTLVGWPTDGAWAAFHTALSQREGLEVIR